ncbi:hypothetical protein OAS01_03620 [Candidatus Pelagibacter sp.]|nr:hypothetical protein [Candidatus Pelagibacter sp.]
MEIKKLTYTVLDIIEILYTKKIKIIIFTFFLFLPLSGIKYYFSNDETYFGSITIFPTDKTKLFSEFNRYNELINDKLLVILGYETLPSSKSIFVQDLQNRKSKNSYYISYTTLIWEFNDILQKKLSNFDSISHIRTLPDPHGYYKNHLSSLTIDFKINNYNESTTDELKKIVNDSILLSKKKFGNEIDNLSEDLENIVLYENNTKLEKFDNLYELILTFPEPDIKDTLDVTLEKTIDNFKDTDETYSDEDNSKISYIVNNKLRGEEQFNILDYCLNDKNMKFGPTGLSNTKILIDKCKEMVKKRLNQDRENIFFSFKHILLDFKSDDFNTVNLPNDKVKISKIESSKYLYSSLFIISLFISIFLTVIHEMLLRKRDSDIAI